MRYAGEPIKEGTIQFRPSKGRASSALISEGAYAIDAEESLKPGVYAVRIFAQHATGRSVQAPDQWSKEAPVSAPEYIQILPPRFNTDTTLTASLRAGPNEIDFDLD